MNKKGQAVESIQAIVIPMLVAGIILAIGFLIWAEAKDQASTMRDPVSVVNGTFTFSNATRVFLNNSMTLACSSVYNASTPNVGKEQNLVLAANYTCSTKGILMLDNSNCGSGNTNCVFNTTGMLVNYNYRPASDAWNATGEVQTAAAEIPTWFPIIVITLIGVVLIGVVSIIRRQ